MSRETKTGGRDATTAVVPGRGVLSIGNPGTELPGGFSWTPLSALARLESGHTPRRSNPEYWDGGIPWIGIRDATANHGQRIDQTLQTISELGLENSSTRLLPEGTVCLSRTASVGYVLQIDTSMCTSQDFVNWVCGPELIPDYLRYALVWEAESIRQWAYGSTHRTLYFPEAKAINIALPSLEVQRATTEVLGALDDKIAANRRVVDAGNVLIRALYSSTPKASTGRTFADVAAVGGGGTPSTKNPLYWDGVVGWATPTDVTGVDGPWLAHTTRRISEEGLNNCASPLYPEGSILMTSRATIGAVAVSRKPMAVNQGFIVLNAVESEMQWWLESQVRARTAEFETWANGATFLEISRGTFKKLPVLECSPEDLERFNRTAQAVRERQSSCQAENDRLACTRDELLPLLMNGRITVKDAERAAEDVL
ncbi:restriction endonuclease subunit S [Dietzia sp. B44]|uniref:restriction endonuclease subunit S n=1 Tax=Dietzia sp. B44 TaxID=1630633 RepID=UPI0015F8AFB6|nr:restriction endonuclease subunit S [Dietzia sp. B44]MBB1055725.1 restriction endonuclease subunit S [Dietzia sp. B44]